MLDGNDNLTKKDMLKVWVKIIYFWTFTNTQITKMFKTRLEDKEINYIH